MSGRRRRWWGLAAGAACGVAAAVVAVASSRAQTAEVGPGDVQDRLVARAVVVPLDGIAEVRARSEGRVLRVLVREGDAVQAGQPLADLEDDAPALELTRRQAERSALAATARGVAEGARAEERAALEAELRAAREELEVAAARHAREERLRASGSVAEQVAADASHGLEMAHARLDGAEARVRLARAGGRSTDLRAGEARVAAADAAVAQARSEVGRTHLLAPIAGVVLARRVDAGDTVSLGSAAAPLFEIADVTRTEVRLEVEEPDAVRLAAGAEVRFSVPGGGPALGRGRVARLGARLERRTIGVEDARVRADGQVRAAWTDWTEQGALLPLGQRLEAVVALSPKPVQAMVPRDAVRVRDGRAVVEVPWGPLTRAVPVTLGLADDHNVELEGLAVGTRVLVRR